MNRVDWSLATRREVLLRCFFICTFPGCEDIATDLHHGELLSEGGSNLPENLIGLCKTHHCWVHGSKNREAIARRWLWEQIDACPVRTDSVRRSTLFHEVERATESVESMARLTRSVYDSNSWNTLEVFLKAAWNYLKEQGANNGKVGCIVLYHFINLYRRRPSRRHYGAALKHLCRLKSTYSSLDDQRGIEWLDPKMRYHEGYLAFLLDPAGNEAYQYFSDSSQGEARLGQRAGQAMSEAQAMVVRLRRGESIGDSLAKLQESLADFSDDDAERWRDQNIPIHMASDALGLGRWQVAYDLIKHILEKPEPPLARTDQGTRPSKSLYIRGVAMFEGGDPTGGTISLEQARKGYLAMSSAEGRASVLLSLGDAYLLQGDMASARKAYVETVGQPRHADNRGAVQVGQARLCDIDSGRAPALRHIYNPWARGPFRL